MIPTQFRDEVLGAWSSHPDHVRRRCKWFVFVAFVPLILVVLAFAIVASDLQNWRTLLAQAPIWFTVTGITIAFAAGATATIALCGRLSEWSHALKRLGNSAVPTVDPWLIIFGLLLGAIAPFFFSQLPALSPRIRLLFALFALFPLVGLLLATQFLGQPSTSRVAGLRTRPRGWVLLLLIAAVAVLVVTLIHDFGLILGIDQLLRLGATWFPWYASLNRPFLGVVGLGPIVFLLFAIWRVWPATVPVSSPTQEGQSGGDKGWFARLLHWFRNLFAKPPTARPPEAPMPPAWLHDLSGANGSHSKPNFRQLRDADVSRPSTRSDLKHLFGVVPTEDQVELLRRFDVLYRQMIENSGASAYHVSCPDLLVEGDSGSGRTTALLACAVYAAFVRGQRVLFVIPDSLRMPAVRDRVDSFLKSLRLHYYVRAGALTAVAMDRWLTEAEAIPHVLIGTVADVEQHLYGYPCPFESLNKLRRLVSLPDVVIVDDLMEFDDAQRAHLLFLLDKQRLLLEASYLPMQVVVSCPKLTDLGAELVGRRLFTVKHLDKGKNLVAIRPCQRVQAWAVRVEAKHATRTTEELANQCLHRGLHVVIYRPGLDEHERTRQQKNLASSSRSGRLTVVTDLDSPLLESLESVDAIFYEQERGQDLWASLRLRLGNDQTVVFAITSRDAAEVDGAITPVLVDRSATPLLVSHLNSVARLMRPFTPVSADFWSRLGIHDSIAIALEPGVRTNCWLDLDHGNEPDYRNELWPYLVLASSNHVREPVPVFGLPDPAGSIYRTATGDRLVTGTPVSPGQSIAARARRARWVDEHAEFGDIGDVDLAHACEFRLIWGRRSIGLRTVQQDQDGAVRLLCGPWHGNGTDRYLPVYHLSWTLSDDLKGEHFLGGPGDGLRWFALRSNAFLPMIQAQIIGQMSEFGETTDIPATLFEYPANVYGLVLDPKSADPAQLAETVGACLSGRWSTGDAARYWPALTGSVNHAMRTQFSGLDYFARAVAFRLTGEAAEVGSAVVWLLEPPSGGLTASRTFIALLQHPSEREKFFRAAEAFLAGLECVEASAGSFIRRATRQGFKGDERIEEVAEALSLIRRALGNSAG